LDRKTCIYRKLFKAFEWAGQGFPCRISTSEASEVEQAREAAGVAWAVQESLSLVGFRRAKPPSWSRRGKKTVGLAWTGQGLPEQFFRRAKPPSWGGRTKQLGWHGLGKGSLVDFRRAKPPSWSGSDERSSELNRAKELAGLAWAGQEFPRRIPTSKASKLGGARKTAGLAWASQKGSLAPDFDEGSCALAGSSVVGAGGGFPRRISTREAALAGSSVVGAGGSFPRRISTRTRESPQREK